ncbi:apolipoprotein L4-like [Trichomycterus rosablanca]|uniref:apolipoprotein L4-like n=1 Tax=Trichomycterus rosablanca TaxID=2290929 RepID=UPI002F357056
MPYGGDFQQPLASRLKGSVRVLPCSNPKFTECSSSFETDIKDVMERWCSGKGWVELNDDFSFTNEDNVKAFRMETERLKEALCVFNFVLSDRESSLQGHITELQDVANNLDKVHKGAKIAGITGGTAGALGVAAAVGGVILAPLTLGASLVVTAAGVGVAAAGTVAGASAAITNKVSSSMDRRKVEQILKNHTTQMEEIEKYLNFIIISVKRLNKYNMSEMQLVDWRAVKVEKVMQIARDSNKATGAISKSSGMIQALGIGMDMYFKKEDSQKLKKGSETKFAKQIRHVSMQMQASLDEMINFKKDLVSVDL